MCDRCDIHRQLLYLFIIASFRAVYVPSILNYACIACGSPRQPNGKQTFSQSSVAVHVRVTCLGLTMDTTTVNIAKTAKAGGLGPLARRAGSKSSASIPKGTSSKGFAQVKSAVATALEAHVVKKTVRGQSRGCWPKHACHHVCACFAAPLGCCKKVGIRRTARGAGTQDRNH